jgi:hypothetical protein
LLWGKPKEWRRPIAGVDLARSWQNSNDLNSRVSDNLLLCFLFLYTFL